MSVLISQIVDKGNHQKERVILRVTLPTDIGRYAAFRTTVSDGGPNTDLKNAFWFPDKSVATGDLVVLYSKAGVPSEKLMSQSKKAHFYYWGSKSSLWGRPGYAFVLLQTLDWKYHVLEPEPAPEADATSE
jgi:hypothetical protein